ncbi:hypothetical protein ACIQOW_38190 [Kitasatospora sp. NPDC091335]|uniref:hypothetical protein n=1 Tax=Kitasatospora sp. NPDC091335 TaxID=3364085 RepID=UPI0037F3705F
MAPEIPESPALDGGAGLTERCDGDRWTGNGWTGNGCARSRAGRLLAHVIKVGDQAQAADRSAVAARASS